MMELSKFPLDSQVCTMEIASFSKTMKELNLSWKSDAPIKMYKNMRMPQFEMEEIVPTTCQESFQIGNYSCLVAEFHMRRAIGFHLVQSYLPTTLIVVISWVSFWMDVDSVPGRTTLGVTTLLTVSSKSSGIQAGLPQVSYVKAIDVWMELVQPSCSAPSWSSPWSTTSGGAAPWERRGLPRARTATASARPTRRSSPAGRRAPTSPRRWWPAWPTPRASRLSGALTRRANRAACRR
nr:glycine receptor subunit alpha-2-like [Penaeus vannamei]